MFEEMGNIKKELENNMIEFTQILKSLEEIESNYNNSIGDYEKRINKTLDVQYKASYITSLIYRITNLTKPMLKKYRGGSTEFMKVKYTLDELNFHMEHFKNHVYTFSQRAKTLGIVLSTKQMANPEVVRFE